MVRAILLAAALCVGGLAHAQAPQDAAKPAVQAKPAGKPAAGKPKAAAAKKKTGGPAWAELNADHQAVLQPLKETWDDLDATRKRKWIGIAKRYSKMKPEAQARVQKRMQVWANLSPEQRRQARENYRAIAKVPPEKRKSLREQWAAYQALTPGERERLVAEPVEPAHKKKK
ncbi:MAG: DUF3106 domain-containing protein [Clostridia bacterium]